MKKILPRALATLILIFVIAAPWLGQAQFLLPVPGGPVSGAAHFYSVLLRGNGEAVVGAKLIFENDGAAPLTEFSARIKNVPLRDSPTFIQELRRCQTSTRGDQNYRRDCKPNEPPDYGGNAYLYDTTFVKLRHQAEGDTYTVTLAEPVPPGSSGAVLTRYRSFGYTTKKVFGRRHFSFETFEVADELNQVQVAVSVDTDLYLKGGKGGVEYRATREDLGVEFGQAAALGAASSPALSKFSEAVARGGQLTKTARELASRETFKVKGAYATTGFGLYWSQWLIALLVVIAIVVGITVWSWRRARRPAPPTIEPPEGSVGTPSTTAPVVGKRPLLTPLAGSCLLGLANAVALMVASLGLGVPALARLLRNLPFALIILATFLGFLVFVAILTVPSLYYGYRYGKKYGFITVGFIILWLMAGVIFFALLFSGDQTGSSPYPYY